MNVRARHKAHYFIPFINDFTEFGNVYLFFHKSKTLECFKIYLTLGENQLNMKIKSLRNNQGREYLYDLFNNIMMIKI